MKRLLSLLGIFAVTIFLGVLLTMAVSGKKEQSVRENDGKKWNLVTSFEPVYMIAERLTRGSAGFQVSNLTSEHAGCLHEYQLTTENMKQLEQADVFFVNGKGMESFLEEVASSYDSLEIQNISEGIECLEEESAESLVGAGGGEPAESLAETGEGESAESLVGAGEGEPTELLVEADEDEPNAHFWMNPDLYIRQIKNAEALLVKKDPQNASIYQRNAASYIEEVDTLKKLMKEQLSVLSGQKIISFHEAFFYLADYLGVEILRTIDLDGDVNLSAGQIREIVDLIRNEGVSYLWLDNQTSEKFLETMVKETGVKVIVLDTLTGRGEGENPYITGMQNNITALEEMR